MNRFLKSVLFCLIGLLSIFIVSETQSKNPAATVTQASSPSRPLFTMITPKITPTPVQIEQIQSGFCLTVPVLMYHHVENLSIAVKENRASLSVDPEIFEQQMAYLVKNGYTSIKADTLIQALLLKQPLPKKSIVVSLDDGYSDMFTNAFPIAKKYGVILNLMIPTGLMGNPGYLTWEQINTMVTSGMTSVFNHTWSHFSLTTGSHDKVIKEVSTAQQELHSHVGNVPKILTYPYGTYNTSIISTLTKELHFVGGFSTNPGTVQCDSRIMALPRTRIGNLPLSSYGI